jgi:hypothetical protein
MIRKFLIAACLILPVAAMAADEPKAEKSLTPQQQKMGTCSKEAKDKKLAGDDRKHFMSECLKSDHAAAGKMTPQQQKMSACSKEAKDKKLGGDERKNFMSTCLKSKEG